MIPKILLCLFVLIMIFTQTFSQSPPLETGVSQTLAKWRSANYSDVRYKLSITLEKGAPLMKGGIEIAVKLTDEGAENDLVLDWRTTQFQNDKDKPFAEVEEVNGQTVKETVQNGVFDYAIDKEHLIISKKYLKTGENTIKIKFASPIKTSGAAITRYVDKEDGAEYVYSLFVPSDASSAFPVFDQPDLKAKFQLNVFAPYEWKVISNTELPLFTIYEGSGLRGGVPKYGLKIFPETKPISTYVFAFAAGEFEEFECQGSACGCPKIEAKTDAGNQSVDVRKQAPVISTDASRVLQTQDLRDAACAKIYVRKSQAEKFKPHADEVFRLNREGIKFLEEYFDYKFPFPKYDLVLIPEFPFGGMEHAGATFLRESSVIFPTEPTKNDYVSRANVIFHEAAHQWFGDTVTMKWFDDLWLKEGFAEFMAYKTLEKVMPEYNAWKIFYERNKQAAYLTDATRGTTPIYQEIPNLSAAKSAYGNIVYRKAPSFLKQAEFYLGEKEFQTAVRSFLKKHEFANAEWTDLVKEFEDAAWLSTMAFYHDYEREMITKETEEGQRKYIRDWANGWVNQSGLATIRIVANQGKSVLNADYDDLSFDIKEVGSEKPRWKQDTKIYLQIGKNPPKIFNRSIPPGWREAQTLGLVGLYKIPKNADVLIFPNYQDYGYGIFLLDEKSRDYVLKNIQTEKDDFLRAMMWGSLWDSVREGELAPAEYVELVIKNLSVETDESTIQTLLGRTATALNYYLSEPPAVAAGLQDGKSSSEKQTANPQSQIPNPQTNYPPATAGGSDLSRRLEDLLIEKMQNAQTAGQKITFYRAFLNVASSEKARNLLKDFLKSKTKDQRPFELKTKDKFDIVTRLLILGDADAPVLLAELEKTETSDEAKRYAYAAKAGIATAENKAKFWNDFVNNKEISESWIEAAFVTFNASKHADLTLPYLEKALAELPNLKRNRKIFFVNGWLAAFIGGQKSEAALNIVTKFLADNPNLDKDLRLKILENSDGLERAVKIRAKFGK